MKQFRINLTGRVFEIRSRYDYAASFCRLYLTDAPAEYVIEMKQEDIDAERAKTAALDEKRGIPVRRLTDAYLETFALHRRLVEILLKDNVILLHGSAISVNGEAYLFTGSSGSGKSTHTRLWRRMLGNKAVMINDDKPLLRFEDGRIMVYGTPWSGKEDINTNTCARLKAVCRLQRGTDNRIGPMPAGTAAEFLLSQCYRSPDAENLAETKRNLQKLVDTVPLYIMSCTMAPEAARISWEVMSGNHY